MMEVKLWYHIRLAVLNGFAVGWAQQNNGCNNIHTRMKLVFFHTAYLGL